MFSKKSKPLIIISVPFGRNVRFFLNSLIFKELSKSNDILIISPPSGIDKLKKAFGGENVYFLSIEEKLNKFSSYLYHFSERLRKNGYWFRFRKGRMNSQWKKACLLERKPKGYVKCSLKNRVLTQIAGFIGWFRISWRIIDKVFGKFFYDTRGIEKYISSERKIVFIQTASFGFQERFLAYCSQKFASKSILIPYTTDQVTVNGYLMNDFDFICSQGPVETDYLVKCHKTAPNRIHKLGMLWFRNVEVILKNKNISCSTQAKNQKVILYAGGSSTYFSKKDEYQTIDTILLANRDNLLSNIKLIYRPVVTKDEWGFIRKKYKDNCRIELQKPQKFLVGMLDYPELAMDEEIGKHLENIKSIDLFVMSIFTSLIFDALYFGKPVISYFPLKASKYVRLISKNATVNFGFSDIPVIQTSPIDLVYKIREVLSNPVSYVSKAKQVLNAWDYRNQNYVSEFLGLINKLNYNDANKRDN